MSADTNGPATERLSDDTLGSDKWRTTPVKDWTPTDWLTVLMRCQNGEATCMFVMEKIRELEQPRTPDTSLPPLTAGPRRKMLVEIEVGADFEKRLDNQWEVEREINAARWNWKWADSTTPPVNGWRPIETAPRNGEHSLLLDEGFVAVGYFDDTNLGIWKSFPSDTFLRPTHWQPLPSPELTPPVDAVTPESIAAIQADLKGRIDLDCGKTVDAGGKKWNYNDLTETTLNPTDLAQQKQSAPSPAPASAKAGSEHGRWADAVSDLRAAPRSGAISQAAREAAKRIPLVVPGTGPNFDAACTIIQSAIDSVAEPLRREVEKLRLSLHLCDRGRTEAVNREHASRERCAELERQLESVKALAKSEVASNDTLQTALDSKTVEAMELREALVKLLNAPPVITAVLEGKCFSSETQDGFVSLLARTDYSLWLPVKREDLEAAQAAIASVVKELSGNSWGPYDVSQILNDAAYAQAQLASGDAKGEKA